MSLDAKAWIVFIGLAAVAGTLIAAAWAGGIMGAGVALHAGASVIKRMHDAEPHTPPPEVAP